MPKTQPKILCVDVGSIRRGRFAWSSNTRQHGTDPDELMAYLLELRESGERVALGFECPAWISVPPEAIDLGTRRGGEGRYPWSAGAGAGALATGLAQIAWIFRNLAQRESRKARRKSNKRFGCRRLASVGMPPKMAGGFPGRHSFRAIGSLPPMRLVNTSPMPGRRSTARAHPSLRTDRNWNIH